MCISFLSHVITCCEYYAFGRKYLCEVPRVLLIANITISAKLSQDLDGVDSLSPTQNSGKLSLEMDLSRVEGPEQSG